MEGLLRALLIAACFGVSPARAQEDYLFPRAGHLGTTLATGIPYVGITDLTLGFGPYAALGAVFGVTPRVIGLGFRPRLSLPFGAADTAPLRIYAIAPLLYYPETSLDAWVLARPTLALELRASDAWRVALGGGALWASSVGALHGEPTPLSYEAPTEEEIAARREQRERAAASSVLFWTVSASAALQLAPHDTAFCEVTTVMQGAGLAGPRWTDFGGPPILVALGVTHSF